MVRTHDLLYCALQFSIIPFVSTRGEILSFCHTRRNNKHTVYDYDPCLNVLKIIEMFPVKLSKMHFTFPLKNDHSIFRFFFFICKVLLGT